MQRTFIFSLIAVPFIANADVKSLCINGEKMLFTCTSKSSVASVCASHDLSENAGYLRYVHSKNGRIDLTYPQSRSLAKHHFKWFYGWSPGFISMLEFGQGEYTYYVYSSFGNNYSAPRKPGGPQISHSWDTSGVGVFKGNSLISNMKCGYSEHRFSDQAVIDLLNSAKLPIANDELLFNNKLPF